MAEMSIKVRSNIAEVTQEVERMAAHVNAAPDDDPAKIAMLEFGEIVSERDLCISSEYHDGEVVVTVSLSPGLQRIVDMVPA